MSFLLEEKCPGLLRAFFCSSNELKCMENYKHNTKVYECLLRTNKMTIEQYRNQYNPHYLIGDKLYKNEIKITDKEFFDDKERRINNFIHYGKFEK